MEKNIEGLWLQFQDKLKAFILSKIPDESVVDDILQDVFIRIHTNIDKLNDDTKIQSWIYQITRNLIADHFRAINKEGRKLPYLFENVEASSDDFMTEALQDMVKMMDDLPPEYCEAICLTELGGMSQKAYAEKIGLSYSGAKSRVQRARLMLKDNLMKCCHYQFDIYGTVIDIHPENCCCCNE
nr:RNA polymerase sigma factor SigZ [Bacteroidota bacterium]